MKLIQRTPLGCGGCYLTTAIDVLAVLGVGLALSVARAVIVCEPLASPFTETFAEQEVTAEQILTDAASTNS